MKTVRKSVAHTTKYIASNEAEILLAHLLNTSREFIMARPEFSVPAWTYLQFVWLIKKRNKGMPLAYLVNHKEFYGLDFDVNRSTLIPRPETELLVDLALKEIEDTTEKHITLIDVGTGSGCIPIAIGKNVTSQPQLLVFASDVSKSALRLAKKNAVRHQISINFLHGHLLQPVAKKDSALLNRPKGALIITANLPYLTQEQRDTEPSIRYEPHSALVADDKGLQLYKELLQHIKKYCDPKKSVTTFFEIDPSQSAVLSSYIKSVFPDAVVKVHTDLAGRSRAVQVHLFPHIYSGAAHRSPDQNQGEI